MNPRQMMYARLIRIISIFRLVLFGIFILLLINVSAHLLFSRQTIDTIVQNSYRDYIERGNRELADPQIALSRKPYLRMANDELYQKEAIDLVCDAYNFYLIAFVILYFVAEVSIRIQNMITIKLDKNP